MRFPNSLPNGQSLLVGLPGGNIGVSSVCWQNHWENNCKLLLVPRPERGFLGWDSPPKSPYLTRFRNMLWGSMCFFSPSAIFHGQFPPNNKKHGANHLFNLELKKVTGQLWSLHLFQIYTEKMNDRFTSKIIQNWKSVKNHLNHPKSKPMSTFNCGVVYRRWKNSTPRNWGHAAARISQQPGAVGGCNVRHFG